MNNQDRIDIFRNRLRAIREERRYSQMQVAKQLNIAVSTYANWEQGRTQPSINDIYNLISVFDIDANELFDVR